MQISLDPDALLTALNGVEKAFDRERITRWGPRSLDLDLLAYDQRKTKAPDMLILPHPRLQDRAFVLKPMMDVMPDWRHPILGKDVAQMLADLPQAEKAGVIALK
ncbi:UNVERIFIED_CONTAM: hypothetical protein GTU68_018477 [Idotea baltica]|nr:hypothetical protein [Idotea baltica]